LLNPKLSYQPKPPSADSAERFKKKTGSQRTWRKQLPPPLFDSSIGFTLLSQGFTQVKNLFSSKRKKFFKGFPDNGGILKPCFVFLETIL